MQYDDKEKLEIYRRVGITQENDMLVAIEKKRLKEVEGRRLSKIKIINNLIQKEYGHVGLRSNEGDQTPDG